MLTDDKVLAFTQSRMSPDERKAFEQEMSGDADLRAQVAAMAAVRDVFAKEQESASDFPGSDWDALEARIDEQSQPTAANDNRPFRLSLLQAACIALASVLGWQAIQSSVFSPDPTSFQTASGGIAGAALQIIFAADATQADVTLLLSELNGRIVDGPSAIGLYIVSFDDLAARDAAYDALHGRSDIAQDVFNN